MQKTYKIVIASMVGASILFTGCSWVKDQLQGAVDDVNKGISDTAKEVGNEINGAVEEATTPAAEEKTEEKTETKAEEKAETPAK